ncbi:MAG: dTMP kinase [Myxococcales bacterium]|nr:dTMP kinase [Myxococcales bacterium]
MRGAFITFDGIEGCGKSTQAHLLSRHLVAEGQDVVLTREPGGTPIAEAIREILLDPANGAMAPLTELLLYEAARAQHVHELIRPAIEAGSIVICDRFYDSTTAYQGAGRQIPEIDFEKLHRMATGGLSPDLTLFLDLPVEEGLKRATNAGAPDRIERESVEFHERVRQGFLELAAQQPERIKTLDARGTPEDIAIAVSALVDPLVESCQSNAP